MTGPAASPPRPGWWRSVAARRILGRVLRWAGALVLALSGGALGAFLAPPTTAAVGPLTASVRVVPSLDPGVRLLLPPAGEVRFPTHRGPVAVEARVLEVDLDDARALVGSPRQLAGLEDSAPQALRGAIVRAALTTTACALAGAVVLSLLVHRRVWRRTGEVAGALVAVLVLAGGATAATLTPDGLAAPRFTGLLAQAPYLTNTTTGLLDRLESYRSGLADIVTGVATLYATAGELPVLPDAADADLVKVLHVSDIHLNPLAYDLVDRLVAQFDVDVVVDTGDVTTWGTDVESSTLRRIGQVGVPYVMVRGNHDSLATQEAVAANANAVVLDGQAQEVAGVVFAGVGDPVFTPDGGAAAEVPADPPPTATGVSEGATPSPSRATGGSLSDAERLVAAGTRLSRIVDTWDEENPDTPVSVALVHDPVMAGPLMGQVPTVLAGHLHSRDVREENGSRLLIEGSTGGAGLTARGLQRLDEGNPLPLRASVLYFARTGERAGRLVAYDEVSVGGFGIASVSLERQVVREDPVVARPEPEPTQSEPTQTPGPTTTSTATTSSLARVRTTTRAG